MGGSIAPFPKHQMFDNNGNPAAGYKLFTYDAGTTTKRATYTDQALSVANANPIILDSAGRATIFLAAASYKFVLAPPTDSDPPSSPLWTQDNVSSVPLTSQNVDIAIVAAEDMAAGKAVFLSDGTGGLTAGRWYLCDGTTSFKNQYATAIGITVTAITGGTAGAVRLAGRITGTSNASVGASYWTAAAGGLSATPGISPRLVGVADSTTSLIVGQRPRTPITYRVSSTITTIGNVGAGEDILHSYSATNELQVNGHAYRGYFWGHTVNNANVKTIRLRLIEGANNTIVNTWNMLINEAGSWYLTFEIRRDAPTSARGVAQSFGAPTVSTSAVTSGTVTVTRPNVTWANSVEIRLTGEATTDNDITMEGGSIEVVGTGFP